MTEEELAELQLISCTEAGKLVGRSPRTVRDWIKGGRVEGWQLGGMWLVSKPHLLEQFVPYECDPDV